MTLNKMHRWRTAKLWPGMMCGLLLTMSGGAAAAGLRPPSMTAPQAIARFERFVQARGLDVDHYLLQSLTYDYVTGEWLIYYLGKGAGFGDALYLMLDGQGEIVFLD